MEFSDAGLGVAGDTAYLPFDFFDQCMAWLRVSAAQVRDFGPIPGARIQCSLGDLAAQVGANRSTLAATGP
ncbi:hypothetical protein ADK75_27110 [Streptomyces virginiae]|uniref:Uncharacterized protein n=1 Tax=Streptomyces virginiae TaxID=1961 RepID=A0A0L8M7S4_STRVG|nr:hypothetical protein [Streptomyces virginiae]KOG46433.1 hypothetical protein ADK75_27110 [Streptomyces virginiae]